MRRPRQDRIEDELRAVRELLRAWSKRFRLGDRRHGDAADLVAGQAGDEHVVERKVARKAPVLDLVRNAPAAAELDRANAGREHLCVDDFAVALLDQRARHAAPAEIEREREADRSAADDKDGGHGTGCVSSPPREAGEGRVGIVVKAPPTPDPSPPRATAQAGEGSAPPAGSYFAQRNHFEACGNTHE